MANVQLTWSASPAEFLVTKYRIYHNLVGSAPTLLAETNQTVTIVYPDQLGYTIGQSIEFHVSAVNATGESPVSNLATVTLPAILPLPPAITDLVAVFV